MSQSSGYSWRSWAKYYWRSSRWWLAALVAAAVLASIATWDVRTGLAVLALAALLALVFLAFVAVMLVPILLVIYAIAALVTPGLKAKQVREDLQRYMRTPPYEQY